MQYQKEEVRIRILEKAKKEFLQNGFKSSSLRKIAADADMTTGGIYTYFDSKEDIFHSIVEKVVEKWEKKSEFFLSFTGLGFENLVKRYDREGPSWNKSNYHFLVSFIDLYRDEMSLLFFCSDGTQFEHFDDLLVKGAIDSSKKTHKPFPARILSANTSISDFFLRNIIIFNINLVKEMLSSEISIEDMLSYEEEITRFFYFGWEALLDQ